jgi:hypothetical protein
MPQTVNRSTVGIDITEEETLVMSAGFCMVSIAVENPMMSMAIKDKTQQEVFIKAALEIIQYGDAFESVLNKLQNACIKGITEENR